MEPEQGKGPGVKTVDNCHTPTRTTRIVGEIESVRFVGPYARYNEHSSSPTICYLPT